MQTVTLGPTDGSDVAIDSGLTPGEKVVTDGADRLKDGATVLLPGDKAPAVAADGTTTQPAANAQKWNGQHHGHHHHHDQGQNGNGGGSGSGP
jgi:multidrug efflux system membrane fusion protein